VNSMESNYAEENLSTEQQETRQEARISGEDGDEERQSSIEAPPREGPQTSDGSTLLSFSFFVFTNRESVLKAVL